MSAIITHQENYKWNWQQETEIWVTSVHSFFRIHQGQRAAQQPTPLSALPLSPEAQAAQAMFKHLLGRGEYFSLFIEPVITYESVITGKFSHYKFRMDGKRFKVKEMEFDSAYQDMKKALRERVDEMVRGAKERITVKCMTNWKGKTMYTGKIEIERQTNNMTSSIKQSPDEEEGTYAYTCSLRQDKDISGFSQATRNKNKQFERELSEDEEGALLVEALKKEAIISQHIQVIF